MKTSNKLLIILSVILLTVPLGIMILVAKSNRIDNDRYNQILLEEETLDKKASRFVTKFDTKSFDKIFIQGADFKEVKIKVFKSNKFAIKITKDLAEQIIKMKNINNTIHINLASSEMYTRGTIIIFSPALSHIKIDDIKLSNLYVKQSDSLTLELGNNASFSISEGIHVKNFFVNNEHITNQHTYTVDNNIYNSGIEKLHINLKNSNINVYDSAISTLDINLNSSNIKVSYQQADHQKSLKNLSLKTSGKCSVDFRNTKIDNAEGEISNETSIQIPVVNLKQILKK